VDTNLNINGKFFESEFNERYGDKVDKYKAESALGAAEKQVDQLNCSELSEGRMICLK
jgi:hypothetical protein